MSEYHEPLELIPEEARDIHRALKSLIEELEAVDWYHQRAVATQDESLRAIVEHNRDEEVEHAAMALEWLRRKMPIFDEQLRLYLFTNQSITEVEEAGEGHGGEESGTRPSAAAHDLNIRDLRERS